MVKVLPTITANALYFGQLATYFTRWGLDLSAKGICWGTVDLCAPSVYSEEGAFSLDQAVEHWQTFRDGCDAVPCNSDYQIRATAVESQYHPAFGEMPVYDPVTAKLGFGRLFGDYPLCVFGRQAYSDDGPIDYTSLVQRSLVPIGEETVNILSDLKRGGRNTVILPHGDVRRAQQGIFHSMLASSISEITGVSVISVAKKLPLMANFQGSHQFGLPLAAEFVPRSRRRRAVFLPEFPQARPLAVQLGLF